MITSAQTLTSRLTDLTLASKPVTLTTYLTIIHKASHECYINYCQGATALYNYLTDQGKIQLSVSSEVAANIINPSTLLRSYYIGELARIVAGGRAASQYSYWYSVIFTTLIKEGLL